MRTLGLLLLYFVPGTRVLDMSASVSTESVANQIGDAAIGPNFILGTNYAASPAGALHVYGLDGKVRQTIDGLDRPHGVDLKGNLAVVAERGRSQLRFFRIDSSSGRLAEAGAIPVFEGQPGEAAIPASVALYRRKSDGALFAIVSRRAAGANGAHLWQYRLMDDGARVTGAKVREFGKNSGKTASEINNVAADDADGYIYYSEQSCCLHKYHADPDHQGAAVEVARHATDKFQGARRGITIAPSWLIAADRIDGKSEYHVYAKRGAAIRPLFILRGAADATDGIEFAPALPGFPDGVLLATNSAGRNLLLFPLRSRY